MSKNNFKSVVPTLPVEPTNTETIPLYDVNRNAHSWMEEIQIEQIVLDMNCMYQTPMNVDQEVLNN